MHRSLDEALQRWTNAGLLDNAGAERMRQFAVKASLCQRALGVSCL
jgi:hypothetical protein